MRKLILPILFTLLTSFVYGQQFLWSTIEKDSIAEKQVPIEYVDYEILKFYDHYKKHYDLSGFSKKRFVEEIDYGFDDWKWINDITNLTVFALKSNVGGGSVVLVMFISEKNINLIIFTNDIVDRNYNYISNSEYDRKKFEIWLKTLKN